MCSGYVSEHGGLTGREGIYHRALQPFRWVQSVRVCMCVCAYYPFF